MSTRKNALDQALDIAGSLTQISTKSLTDETSALGQPISGQTGAAASVSAFAAGIATITGLTGMAAASVGRFLTISGAASGGNNGTFLITAFNSATSVDVSNPSGVAGDGNNGSISWTERDPYSLEDDLNFVRTDRTAIKGVTYDAAIPTYERPTAVGTPVPTNLSNVATKTTDAKALVVNRKIELVDISPGDGYVTLSITNGLKHADSVDRTGVPIFDGADAGDYLATFAEITDGYTDPELFVQGGVYDGYKVIGRMRAGTTGVSDDSVEVEFRAVEIGADLSTSVPYSWEASQVSQIDIFYPFRERFDIMDENALRTILVSGVSVDAGLSQDVSDIRQTIGMSEGDTDLSLYLTNTGIYYPFFDLPDATPSVVEALNTLNEQIGDRDYTGSILTDGYTITQSLQELADAITTGAAAITRVIERLSADISKNTAHTLPGGNSYTLDATDQGAGLWLYWRGLLRHPGPVVDGNDYDETSTTSFTAYTRIKADDIIDYFLIT